MDRQSSLFEQEPLELIQAVDIDAVAKHISDNARPVAYEDRTSESAADQGWGPQHVPEIPAARLPRKPRPYTTGPIRGESEGEISPAGRETNWQLNSATKSIGRLGVAAARKALENPEG
ncbi:hypothetical protein H0X10_01845 [Candidatus Saccharibacteria bacterium]|nr:hypothetical protein [Candidatus Saccharibacteria bacterium]